MSLFYAVMLCDCVVLYCIEYIALNQRQDMLAHYPFEGAFQFRTPSPPNLASCLYGFNSGRIEAVRRGRAFYGHMDMHAWEA